MSNVTIKDLARNEEIDSNDLALIGGGISFPSVLHGAPIKLIAPPQPVTKLDGLLPSGLTGSSTALAFPSDDDRNV